SPLAPNSADPSIAANAAGPSRAPDAVGSSLAPPTASLSATNAQRQAMANTNRTCAKPDAERPAYARQQPSQGPPAEPGWYEPPSAQFPPTLGAPIAAGNGLTIDSGRGVVTLKRLVAPQGGASIWVRNARGELRRARVDDVPPSNDGDSFASLS